MKERFRILLYDARAQGKSDLGSKELSLDAHVADLEALLAYLHMEDKKLNMVGLSPRFLFIMGMFNRHQQNLLQ